MTLSAATFERWLRAIALTVMLGATGDAVAVISTPILAPLHPVAGEMVSVSATSDVCDAMLDIGPGLADVTRNGNAIRIVVDTIREDNFDWCIYPFLSASYEIGRLEEGAYTLRVDRRYTNIFGVNVVTLAMIPFEVAPFHEPPSIPAIGVPALLLLAIGMFGLAYRNAVSRLLRRRLGLLSGRPTIDGTNDTRRRYAGSIGLSTCCGSGVDCDGNRWRSQRPQAGTEPADTAGQPVVGRRAVRRRG